MVDDGLDTRGLEFCGCRLALAFIDERCFRTIVYVLYVYVHYERLGGSAVCCSLGIVTIGEVRKVANK